MCELLAMSANVPTDIVFSFTGLVERGGVTGPHSDGWGITFYEGKGCRSFKDAKPSSESKIAELVKSYPIKSCAVVSHVRQANRGKVALQNTHPFTRELWGRYWTYAHNGQLSSHREKLGGGLFHPVGTTDSELAFCWLLERLREHFPNRPKDMARAFRFAATLADDLRDMGVFNMLLTDGNYMLAYCSNSLCWITRRAPFGIARLMDIDVVVDFHTETTPNDIVTVVATNPLTVNEQWHRMEPGEWKLFRLGKLVAG